MTGSENTPARRTFLRWLALFALGLLALGAGKGLEWEWLQAVGIVLLAPVALAVTILVGFAAFFVVVFSGLRLMAVLSSARARWGQVPPDPVGESRAGLAVPVEECYRLLVTRHTRVADPDELREPVTRLVRGLRRIGGRAFALYGCSPAFNTYRVLSGWRNRVPSFLATSEIQWGFGRELPDPTHQLVFFTRFNGTRAVYLRVSFVLTADETTGPGLRAELRLTPAAAGREGAGRTARLDRILRLLVETLSADESHIEFPAPTEAVQTPTA